MSEASESPPLGPEGAVPRPVVAPYRVRLELFEGPLDLLLHLVKKNELEITDVPTATITEQYLEYLELMSELRLDIAGEYLVMAATLLLIKSRELLPSDEPEDEEEPDPRADLVRQLMEYQRYREAAEQLAARPWLGRDTYTRPFNAEGVERDPDEEVPLKVTTWQLLEAFRAVLERARPEPVHEVQAEPVALRDRVREVLGRLAAHRRLPFRALFDDDGTRTQVIVTFLALLELLKLGAVGATQAEPFGEIDVVLIVDDVGAVQVDLVEEFEGGVQEGDHG